VTDYRAWLCDLDGTLYHARALKLLMGLELLLFGLPEVRTIRAFRKEHERLRNCPAANGLAVNTPFEEQVERTARRLRLPNDRVQQSAERWMIERPLRWLPRFRRERLFREIVDFRARGGLTAVVSDYPAARKLDALGLARHFDVVVASGESGGPSELKPAPDGYLKAARRLGVTPEQCLVIGDRDDADGAAARAAGMAFRLIA
jgi:HAD superfamily hydrolase (TIGR01549 family)